ncbi:MAG: bifunctional 5,10-methylenetetrahydrofolate dehydrogenase/5,10-methenyltetrahydrofolate cyclohydrolase, partial [Spirochaetales bacterium]|nr:bifunctional 5,10-methylenetetrahydrofolate dehydrogenase/5,10-methenyltetrahydrofolate cyclohydrolase [Spirochaetales bacterium]
LVRFDESVTENEFVKKMDEINRDDKYSGMILQLPLPRQISHSIVSRLVDYRKDVDGVSPFNQGLLFSGRPFMIPATAWAVDLTLAKIAKECGIDLSGKKIAIVGRSVTVGKPVLHLALKRNMVPVVLHTKASHPEDIASDADVIVACCGSAELIDENWVKKGTVIIDVGINTKNDESGKSVLCGDVNAAAVIGEASLVTAVPGGIGSVTSALLFANTLKGWYMVRNCKELRFDFEV